MPSLISNAVIDSDVDTTHDYNSIFTQLENLGCKAVQIRFYSKIKRSSLASILDKLVNSSIVAIDLIMPYDMDDFSDGYLLELVSKNLRINTLFIHSCPSEVVGWMDSGDVKNVYIYKSDQIIDNESHCGVISSSYFSVNIEAFSEAQKLNSCLNRKISVDKNGEIKNCPSLKRSFGNVSSTNLIDVVSGDDFRFLWNVSKDQIDICNFCEFRYICTDCRAFLHDDDYTAKPKKCSYDPYSTTWKD